MSIDLIDPYEFNFVSNKLRDFFRKKQMIEVAVQHRLSILAACEDPTTISTYDYSGQVWPLPQTGQMHLEYELLTKPNPYGYFCYTTSYRQEPNPVIGRHNLIFPMIEFELPGNMNTLFNFEKELLEYLGYPHDKPYPEGNYFDVCAQYGVDELTHEHEQTLYQDYGPVFFLKNFPESTSPFWNMSRNDITANKIDVILSGVETIGSAERSCDPVMMRNAFHTISEGNYAKTLFGRFGKKRVMAELDTFLSHDLKPRCGGGIGVTRLISSLKKEGLMKFASD